MDKVIRKIHHQLYLSVDLQDSEECDMLSRVSLNWSSLKHTATTEIDIAETTRTFWEGNNIQKLAVRKYNTKKQISNHVNTIKPVKTESCINHTLNKVTI